MTIHDIKRANEAAGRYYFSRDTLKHFGQRVKDFKIRKAGGRVFVQAAMSHNGRYMGETFAEFDPQTGKMSHPAGVDRTKQAVSEFLESIK